MYAKLVNDIEYNKVKKRYETKCAYLQRIGVGKRATVFRIMNEEFVIKIYHPYAIKDCQREVKAYQKLINKGNYYINLHEYGENYIIVDYVRGETLAEWIKCGKFVPESVIEEVDKAILHAQMNGLNPSDIHIRNVMWDGQGIKIIDLEGFTRKGKCYRWDILKKFYYKCYNKKWCPKKISRRMLNIISGIYRSFEKLLGYKQLR